MTSYTVQTRNGPKAKWKALHWRTTFTSLSEAIMCARQLDQDGRFNPRDASLRIISETGRRVMPRNIGAR